MRNLLLLAFSATVAIAPAHAQTRYDEPIVIAAPRGAPPVGYQARTYNAPVYAVPRAVYAPPGHMPNLGGGYIEGMIVGREPVRRPTTTRIYAVPSPGRTLQLTPGGTLVVPPDDPRVQRQRREQSASLNGAPATRRVMDPAFRRTEIKYDGPHAPGTIVVDTSTRYLYLVQKDGMAIRYGVGVGKEGFGWKGEEKITMKREWPDWRPPAEMLQRRPELPRFMPGGPENPLGARALYLGSTLYRIHGSNEPWTIGQRVSSGCIRMTNDDVTDLYTRVGVGTKVVVL